MTQEQFRLITDAAKIGIDLSPLSKEEKEYRKAGIDFITDIAKIACPPQQPIFGQVIQIHSGLLQSIKEAAKRFSLRRVIYLWIPSDNGQRRELILVEGENSRAFMKYMGFPVFNDFTGVSCADMDAVEKYGIILYEAPDLLTRT